jgi:hypothetical protein
MTRRLHVLILAVAVALTVGACGDAATPSGPASPGGSVPVELLNLRYTCGKFPFGVGLLTAGPGNAEQADHPAAASLRAHLAGAGPEIDSLPDAGWHLAGMDELGAEFLVVDGGGSEIEMVVLEHDPNRWVVTGWGQCQPRIVLAEGLNAAEWAFDPAQPEPGPATQAFDAMVTELACNSGQPAVGRVVGPEIVRTPDTILVMFAVRPRPGNQDCPSNPATRFKVDLGEPLGERRLLDGGRFPPGDPTVPRP